MSATEIVQAAGEFCDKYCLEFGIQMSPEQRALTVSALINFLIRRLPGKE